MDRTTVVIPEELRDQAKKLDINISDVCRYALESAIPAARLLNEAGDEFETITIQLLHQYSDGELQDETELVQFIGKHIHSSDEPITDWYLTPSGSIVRLEDEGGSYQEGTNFLVFDELSDLREHVPTHDFVDFSQALQAAESALGQAPTPRMLNI